LKNTIGLFFLTVACLLPVGWRLMYQGLTEPIGLLSDAGFGCLILLVSLFSPHWVRIPVLLLWVVAQATAHELVLAMQRLPNWQDLQYLADPDFIANSTAGLNFSSPVLIIFFVFSTLAACCLPTVRPQRPWLLRGAVLCGLLLFTHGLLNNWYSNQSVIARYNPMHWFLVDTLASVLDPQSLPDEISLPQGLNELDLDAPSLLAKKGKAKNVLIVILEGIPGMDHPEIGQAMGVTAPETEMHRLATTTGEAMLIPDFTAHSHQTIRGLYSILCGDVAKQSWDTPKAFELQANPTRAQDCLPALMTRYGWSTHFLQAANLGFMGKDRIMPRMGFQQVHGTEWFTEPNPFPFQWGVVDSVFFQGAAKYIAQLRAKKHPWLLTLLTVGTHQPYAVPDDIAAQYPSRKEATVALLDQAVAEFIDQLRRDGVLKDTLVIITSDESHGSPQAEWISSWGLGMVLAPEHKRLPRIKEGGFGLVDITPSVLDYLGVKMPPTLMGRSLFRTYTTPREMVSYTTSKRRWHTSDNLRYECTDDNRCWVGIAPSLLGPPPADFAPDTGDGGVRLVRIAKILDHKLLGEEGTKVLQFANGERRKLPEKITNEWGDNLVGAQYLDFPGKSKIEVSIRYKALKAPPTGVQLKLLVKEWEYTQHDVPIPVFPVVHKGEEGEVEFEFTNPKARQYFSFHLLGEGKNAEIQMEEFNVKITREEG
jgi:hypothetical protein